MLRNSSAQSTLNTCLRGDISMKNAHIQTTMAKTSDISIFTSDFIYTRSVATSTVLDRCLFWCQVFGSTPHPRWKSGSTPTLTKKCDCIYFLATKPA